MATKRISMNCIDCYIIRLSHLNYTSYEITLICYVVILWMGQVDFIVGAKQSEPPPKGAITVQSSHITGPVSVIHSYFLKVYHEIYTMNK